MDITDGQGPSPFFKFLFFVALALTALVTIRVAASRPGTPGGGKRRGQWDEGGGSSSSPRLGGFFVAALHSALQCTALNCPRDEARSRTEDKTLSHGQNRNIARGCR
jgi:hypothetical protein